jgi:hypothetical protein
VLNKVGVRTKSGVIEVKANKGNMWIMDQVEMEAAGDIRVTSG